MNKDVIEDLKQFITVAISQQTSDLRDDIKDVREDIKEIREDIKTLDSKIDDLSNSVADAMHDSNEDIDKQLKDHETRITKLEASAA